MEERCDCGRVFECEHKFNEGELWTNHCMKCGKGYQGDMCKGKCPEHFEV